MTPESVSLMDVAMKKHYEQWTMVPQEFGKYEVSSLGRVRKSLDFVGDAVWRRYMRFERCKGDYWRVIFANRKRVMLHVLVLTSFTGKCPDGMESAHIDGDPTNNELSNLEWKTRIGNWDDRKRHMRERYERCGEYNRNAKLTPKDVLRIREMMSNGFSGVRVARVFGLSASSVYSIRNGKTWSHVKDQK